MPGWLLGVTVLSVVAWFWFFPPKRFRDASVVALACKYLSSDPVELMGRGHAAIAAAFEKKAAELRTEGVRLASTHLDSRVSEGDALIVRRGGEALFDLIDAHKAKNGWGEWYVEKLHCVIGVGMAVSRNNLYIAKVRKEFRMWSEDLRAYTQHCHAYMKMLHDPKR